MQCLLFNAVSKTIASNAAGEVKILGHHGDSMSMDGTKVGILKHPNQVGLGSLLKCLDGRGLESDVCLAATGNLTDQSLKGHLSEE